MPPVEKKKRYFVGPLKGTDGGWCPPIRVSIDTICEPEKSTEQILLKRGGDVVGKVRDKGRLGLPEGR